MLKTTSLQTPKSGRSRFSKALPAPPPFPAEAAANGTNLNLMPTYTHTPAPTLLTHTQTRTPTYTHTPTYMSGPVSRRPVSPPSSGLPLLKQLPPIDLGPPLPPPKEFEKGILDWDTPMATAAAKPLDSPLPPLPQKPGPPPLMSIPRRRPVGAPAQALSPAVTLAPAPVPVPVPVPVLSPIPASTAAPSLAPSPAPATAPEIISPNPLPSPVTSLSSLLSAYNTDHTSESTPRSSTNSTNDTPGTKDSYSDVSPNQEGSRGTDSPTLPADPKVQSATKDGGSQPPPPPIKDPQPDRQQHQNGSPISDHASTEQLWRRRSVKSDKNIAISELKLTSSNGSTVASGQPSISSQGAPSGASSAYSGPLPSHPSTQTASSAPSAQVRVPLPKSSNAGLPGKNVRPVASRQQINEGEDMGQLASRLKSKDNDNNNNGGYGKNKAPPQQHMLTTTDPSKPLPTINAPPTITRLPTPEYEHNEARSPLSNTVISPVSPASSPELPVDANPSVSPASPPAAANNTNPVLGYQTDNSGLGVPRPLVGLPSSPAANRGQNRPVNQPFPTRSSSKAGSPNEARQPATEVPGSLQVGIQREPPRPANPEYLRTISETGSAASGQTLKTKDNSPNLGASLDASLPERQTGEDEETMTDNPGAALFPRDWFTPIPEDGILDPPPLKDMHFRCITNHRYMTANRQRYNPIACGTCGLRDRNSDAYICSACHLNICAICSGNLRRCRGDLRQLTEQIKGRAAPVDQDDRTVTLTQAAHNGEGDHMGGRSFERENVGGRQHMQ